ncbi:unnamed protein product, partial [Effrenium voratum]
SIRALAHSSHPIMAQPQLIAPEQTHGQSRCARCDPCFNAPISCSLGVALVLGGAALFLVNPFLAAAVAVAGLALAYCSVSQACRRRLRLGGWPVSEPGSLQEIQELLRAQDAPLAVGEAWSYHIGLKSVKDQKEKVIALGNNWAGVVAMTETSVRVKSGMLWGELMRELWEVNKAPMDRPAFDQMSLGASVRVAAHGFHVGGWFIDYVLAVQAVERGTGRVAEAKRGEADFWTLCFNEAWVITEVELETQQNRLVRVEGKSQSANASTTQEEVDRYVQAEATEWREAPFVNMSIGGTAINRKWYTLDPVGVDDKDQNCLSYRLSLAWIGVSGIDSLGDAQTIMRTLWLVSTTVSRWLGTANFEFFVQERLNWDQVALTFVKFHATYGGRTDFRERVRNGKAVTALDAVIYPKDIASWFEMVYNQLNLTQGILHPGKYDASSSAGKVRILDFASFWTQISS